MLWWFLYVLEINNNFSETQIDEDTFTPLKLGSTEYTKSEYTQNFFILFKQMRKNHDLNLNALSN